MKERAVDYLKEIENESGISSFMERIDEKLYSDRLFAGDSSSNGSLVSQGDFVYIFPFVNSLSFSFHFGK